MNAEDHLTVEQLDRVVFGHEPLSDRAVAHLAGCAVCRQALARVEALRSEIDIAVRSAPSGETLQGYYALYDQVHTGDRSLMGRAWSWVRASLMLDSRLEPMQAGLRNLSLRQYRLLFGTESADIELLIALDGNARRVEGDLAVLDEAALGLPALIQFTPVGGAGEQAETATDDDGRFRLEGVSPGIYDVAVTPAWGETIQIEPVEIT